MIDCAASMIDFIPEEHTLLIVVQGTSCGRPANIAACLAGACPKLACNTFPMYTSFTIFGSIPAFSIAPFIAAAPNFVADTDDKDPPKLPIGVRTADTITTSLIICFFMI